VPAGERVAAVQRALELAQLTDRADTRTEKLSGGMRRRLLIARGLVHQPELVLLDEPTVGLDPQVRQELWALIDALRARGVTVLMSTHYIDAGLPTRRTGPAVSVLRAEDMPDDVAAALGSGLARPSNLEDVFVLLTGETVE
jgi:lipooligosaccharide transport system ATP-binding protein